MTFYKIIKNNIIIDVGATFLRINEKYNRPFICGVANAQFAQSSNEEALYHDQWLDGVPNTFTEYIDASIVVIDEQEYKTLKQQLNTGVEIEAEVEPEELNSNESIIEMETPEPDPEPMSIADMRILITTQQQEIEQLKKQIATILENT